VCVAVTCPVMFGNVVFTVALMSRMWSSALFMPSEEAGLEVTRSEMKVAVSKGNYGSFLCRFVVESTDMQRRSGNHRSSDAAFRSY